jgi:hypothetical protein
MLDECEAHSPLAFGSVRCGCSVAATMRGPQVARAVGRVVQVPGLIAPDDAAAAGTADLTLGNLGGPAPAKGLVLRPVAPLFGCSLSSAHVPIFWGDVDGRRSPPRSPVATDHPSEDAQAPGGARARSSRGRAGRIESDRRPPSGRRSTRLAGAEPRPPGP